MFEIGLHQVICILVDRWLRFSIWLRSFCLCLTWSVQDDVLKALGLRLLNQKGVFPGMD